VIKGIGHAAFAVQDLERSLAFYCRGLGLREAFRLYDDRGRTWIVYLHIQGLDFLELFPEPQRPAATGSPSYRHLCLLVDDLDETLRELAARGVQPDGPPRQGKDRNRQAWLTDPDGNRIELMEIAPDSPQQAAAEGRVPVGEAVGLGPGPGDRPASG
jgi:lactoylglutathione lyase